MTTTDGTIDYDQTLNTDWQAENRESKYKSLQSDYTRKAQELAELKNKSQEQPSVDEEALRSWIESNWFVKKDDIMSLKQQIEQENKFKELLTYNPELEKFWDAITTIAKAENLAFEDVIEKYKFWSKDKLKLAKDSKLMWDRQLETKQKSIEDMTSAEYAEWKKSNLKGWSKFETLGEI